MTILTNGHLSNYMLTIWFQHTLLRKANTKLYYDIRKWQYNATLKINEK